MDDRLDGHGDSVRLTIGTAQWGMPYGVANRSGPPSYSTIVRLVELAYQAGVLCFDTAAAYGDSESLLGRALADLRLSNEVVVVTKTLPLTAQQHQDGRLAADALAASIQQSKSRLRLERLPLVLLHREEDLLRADVLQKLIQQGDLQAIGVSCGHEAAVAKQLAEDPRLSALQLPCNLLDRRHVRGGAMTAARGCGKRVFVRSVFLQGLLVMPEDEVPQRLASAIPWRRRFEQLASQAGCSIAEFALRFVMGQPGATDIVLGVESEDQLRVNLQWFARGPLPPEAFHAAEGVWPTLPPECISPVMWR